MRIEVVSAPASPVSRPSYLSALNPALKDAPKPRRAKI